jgi:hypothetical protein
MLHQEGIVAADLRRRLELVEAENADLRHILGFSDIKPLKYKKLGLAPSGCYLLAALMARPMGTYDGLMFALHQYDADARADMDPKIVQVQVCHMRRVLKTLGIIVTTVWGKGYKLEPEEKLKVAALVP